MINSRLMDYRYMAVLTGESCYAASAMHKYDRTLWLGLP